MFKNLLIGGLTLFSTIVHACWFTADNFNTCYIAGVNSYVSHYSPAESIGSAVYKNGQTVDFPLTVWVKVSDRFADQPGEAEGKKAIIHAVLQYRVLPNGRWKTVRELKNLNWDMDFQNPVALFGKNNVSMGHPRWQGSGAFPAQGRKKEKEKGTARGVAMRKHRRVLPNRPAHSQRGPGCYEGEGPMAGFCKAKGRTAKSRPHSFLPGASRCLDADAFLCQHP